MKTTTRIVAATLILTLAPSLATSSPTTLQQRIEAERAKAAQIQAQLHAKRSELHSVTLRYQDLQSQLQETNDAISTVNARIGDLAALASATQRKIDWTTIQLDAAKNSLKLHDDMLKKRLVNIYENGDLTYASVLLSAQSFNDFVERWKICACSSLRTSGPFACAKPRRHASLRSKPTWSAPTSSYKASKRISSARTIS